MTAPQPDTDRSATRRAWPMVCELLALLLLIGIVALRPLILESYDSASSPMTEALGSLTDPSPVRTLVFDLLILVAAALWLIGRAMDPERPRYRWTGIEIGAGIVTVAAIVSSLAAGSERIAINASLDWCCLPLMTIVLVNLLAKHVAYRRILLAAILAGGVVQAAQCILQYFEQAGTIAFYQERKEEFWAQQGVSLDSSQVEMFERRMLAREATGFLGHPGVTGSHLAMCVVAALAVLVYREPKTDVTEPPAIPSWLPRLGQAALIALLAIGMLLTRSRGAVAAAILSLLAWSALHVLKPRLSRHPRRSLALGWLLVALGLAAAVGHGLYHGSLPGASLNFRWKYWQAAAHLIADHPLTGVGRGNFGNAYTRYKSIESPEEIANPHNLFVEAAADFGLPGLVGLVALLLGASCAVVKRRASTADAGRAPPSIRQWVLAGLILLAVVTVVRTSLLDTADAAYVYYVTVIGGLAWSAGFLMFGPACGFRRPGIGGGSMALGLAAALIAFLVHDLINFALLIPGAATVFFALLALLLTDGIPQTQAARQPESRARTRAFVPAAAAVTVTLLVAIFLVAPVWRANTALQQARQAAMNTPPSRPIENHSAFVAFRRAAAADPLDPTPLLEQGRWLAAIAAMTPDRAEGWQAAAKAFAAACERDPQDLSAHRLLARTRFRLALASRAASDFAAAVEASKAVLERYPQSPRDLADLAEVLLMAGRQSGDPDLLAEAAATAQQALDLDQQRPEWETIRRLRPRETAQLADIISSAAESGLPTAP